MKYGKMRIKLCVSVLLASALASCSGSVQRAFDENGVIVPIERIDRLARDYVSLDSISGTAGVDSMCQGISVMLEMIGSQSGGDVDFNMYANSEYVRIFQPDIEARLNRLDSVEYVLGTLSGNIDRLLPKASFSRVFGIVTPYRQSIVVADSIVLVGLNHYLGADYPGYEPFESYLLPFKVVRRIPLDIAEAVVAVNYPYQSSDNATVLNRLLYEGALMCAVMKVLPDVTPWTVLNYEKEEADAVEKNEPYIWNAIIGRELLYSADPMDAQRLVSQAPSTAVIDASVPGMAGRYIGYKIVESYIRRHPESTLEFLLSPDFYNNASSFIEARYSGR